MDDCSRIDWNPIQVGQPHSQLAAVIAGFLFAGIVFLLGRRRPSAHDSYPYVLMLPSFFVLLLDSFFFSAISGEQSCNRAWTETMIAAGLLGTGSLGVFAGLSWVIYNSRRGEREPLRIVLVISRVIAIIILTHLQVTTVFYLRDIYSPNQPPGWLAIATWLITGGVVGLLICASLLRRRRQAGSTAVHAAAYCSLFYGVVCSVAFAILGGRPKAEWEPTPTWITVTAVLIALTTAGVATTAQVAALPSANGAKQELASVRTTVLAPRSPLPASGTTVAPEPAQTVPTTTPPGHPKIED